MAEMNIDCVDGTGEDEFVRIHRQQLPQALRVHSIGHIVRSIEGRLGNRGANLIRRLRVFGHGGPGSQGLGQSGSAGPGYLQIQMSGDQLHYQDVLARLTGRFTRSGWVELHGCHVGRGDSGRRLVLALARLWQVSVAAGTKLQYAAPGFEVAYIVARRDGRVEERTVRAAVPAAGTTSNRPSALEVAAALVLVSPVVGLGFAVGAAGAASLNR